MRGVWRQDAAVALFRHRHVQTGEFLRISAFGNGQGDGVKAYGAVFCHNYAGIGVGRGRSDGLARGPASERIATNRMTPGTVYSGGKKLIQ